MKIFVISEFKIHELEREKPAGDLLCDDLVDALAAEKTCVLEDFNIAIQKLERDPKLNYLYEIDLVRRVI